MNFEQVAGIHISNDLALNYDLACRDAGGDVSVFSYGYAMSGQIDRSLYPAIDVDRFRARDFAFDHKRLAAHRGLLRYGRCRTQSGAKRRRFTGRGGAGLCRGLCGGCGVLVVTLIPHFQFLTVSVLEDTTV